MAGRRETDALKPIDTAISGMVGELPGRNESERTGGPESSATRRPSLHREDEGSMAARNLADARRRSGGVIATARWQGRAKQLEKPSSSRREIGGA